MARPRAGSEPPASFQSVFAVLFCVGLSSAAGSTAMQSLLPAIGRSAHIADNLVVTISSLSAFLAIVATPYWAHKADRIGRKPVVLIGVAGVAVSMVLTGLAVLAGVHQLYSPAIVLVSLIGARSLYGLIGLAATPAIQSYVAVHTTREERTNAMALLASAQGIGTIIGPAVAPLLIFPVVTLGGPFFAFALVAGVIFVLVMLRVPGEPRSAADRPSTPRPRTLDVLGDKAVMPFVVYGVVVSFAAASAMQTLGFVVIDRMALEPIEAAKFTSVAMMAGAMAVLVAQWGLIRMLKLTPRSLLLWGAVLVGIGSLMQAFAPTFQTIVFAFALANLGLGFARPGFTAGASLAVDPDRQSVVAGTIGSINAIGLIGGPITALTLYQWWRPAPFLLSAVSMVGLLVYYWLTPALRDSAPHQAVSEEAIEAAGPEG